MRSNFPFSPCKREPSTYGTGRHPQPCSRQHSSGPHRRLTLHQLGELHNRVAETMAYRASGLNLVVNAIILGNTVYLSRANRFNPNNFVFP
nr:Tn3 family transposase [Sphingomonas koreensis]